MRALYNFVAFQAAWFAAVLGAARGHEALGIGAVILVLAVHLWVARDRPGEPLFLLVTLPIGFVVDAILSGTGSVVGIGQALGPWVAAPWLLAMWPLFGTLFNESMRWMRGRYVLGVAFGVVGAPLSYLAGERLGAVRLAEDPVRWIGLVGITWGGAMWLLLRLQARLTPALPR